MFELKKPKDNYYLSGELVNDIKNLIPSFCSLWYDEEELASITSLIVSELGEFLALNILNNNIEMIEKVFHFVNISLRKGGDLTNETIRVDIFNHIFIAANNSTKVEKQKLLNIPLEYLSKEARTEFLIQKKYF